MIDISLSFTQRYQTSRLQIRAAQSLAMDQMRPRRYDLYNRSGGRPTKGSVVFASVPDGLRGQALKRGRGRDWRCVALL